MKEVRDHVPLFIFKGDVNDKKTVEKRKVTGRDTGKMSAQYRADKNSGRGFRR